MSLWKKMVTALRGGASEVGESIVDAQALRILDQEIRDADASMLAARNQLIQIKAKHKLSVQRVEEHDKNIANWEQKAIAAMNKGEEALALECAEKVSELTALRDQEKAAAEQFGTQVTKLTTQVTKAEGQIKALRQQADMAKARDSVQKAQINAAAATGGANGRLETAVGSLARIKQRQDEQDAKLEAAEELADVSTGSDLERRLQDAGIGAKSGGAADVLARLKAQSQSNNSGQ
jgi:phage shock protein A